MLPNAGDEMLLLNWPGRTEWKIYWTAGHLRIIFGGEQKENQNNTGMVDYSRFDNIHDSDDENDDQHERSREANKILTGSF